MMTFIACALLVPAASHAAQGLEITMRAMPTPAQCNLELIVTNTGSVPLELKFNTAQRFDFYAKDQDQRIIWQWSNEMVFADALAQETLQPRESRLYKAQWSYVRNDTRCVKAGPYQLMGALTAQPQNQYSKPQVIFVSPPKPAP